MVVTNPCLTLFQLTLRHIPEDKLWVLIIKIYGDQGMRYKQADTRYFVIRSKEGALRQRPINVSSSIISDDRFVFFITTVVCYRHLSPLSIHEEKLLPLYLHENDYSALHFTIE